jgi:hypothetical protein
MQQHQLFQ